MCSWTAYVNFKRYYGCYKFCNQKALIKYDKQGYKFLEKVIHRPRHNQFVGEFLTSPVTLPAISFMMKG